MTKRSREPERATHKPRVSRRAVLIGATGTAAMATAGTGVVLLARQQSPGVTQIHPTATPQKSTNTTQTPTRAPQDQPFIYRGQFDTVWTVAWSPAGQRIASCSDKI